MLHVVTERNRTRGHDWTKADARLGSCERSVENVGRDLLGQSEAVAQSTAVFISLRDSVKTKGRSWPDLVKDR